MAAIEWTPKISVGDEIIDNQHKMLLSQINLLFNSLKEGKGGEVIKEIISYLDDYINNHLAYEEKYMLEHGYPAYPEHKQIHIGFIKNYEEFKKEMEDDRYSMTLALKVRKFLGDWWLNHIAKEDHKYFEYIKSHPESGKMMEDVRKNK